MTTTRDAFAANPPIRRDAGSTRTSRILLLLEIDVASKRIKTPPPQMHVRLTGYVTLAALDAEKTGPLTAFLSWLTAEQRQA